MNGRRCRIEEKGDGKLSVWSRLRVTSFVSGRLESESREEWEEGEKNGFLAFHFTRKKCSQCFGEVGSDRVNIVAKQVQKR